jgi:ABC-type phosphate transport system substrate-binding protein
MEKRKAIVIAAVVAVATIGAAVVLMPVQAVVLSGKLTIAGSTTVLPINQDCASIFVDMNPAL